MSSIPSWISCRDYVVRFFRMHVLTEPNRHRLVRTSANGQPAVGVYRRGPGGRFEAHAIQVLSFTAAQISRIDTFLEANLFSGFGLPPVYPADTASRPAVDTAGSWADPS